MRFSDIKEQIAKGNLSWEEVLSPRNLFSENRRELKLKVIKRSIPWWMPCKDWLAGKIEKNIN